MLTSAAPYAPLDISMAQIRLIVIDHINQNGDLICTLQTVPLADSNPFYALSYAWGDADDMQKIILDGQCVETRKNLYDFMRSLCNTFQGPIRVWVDYLCINQNDLDERAAQVAMMGQIYSAADSVYAWLGPSTAGSERLIDFLDQSKVQHSPDEPYAKIHTSDLSVVHALEDVVGRPYWTRLWIIQEVVLAKRLWLFCGSRYMSWHDLYFALAGTTGFGQATYNGDSLHEKTKLLQHLKESRESSSPVSLSNLVHKFVAAQCQDGRDKIYALLSLADQHVRNLVKIDYRKPLLQVLLDTYALWASEWILDQDGIRDATPGPHSYTPALFCQELELLFPESQLLDLYDDQALQQQTTTNVTLKGFWQREVFEFRHIAAIPEVEEPLTPISLTANEGRELSAHPTISQMIISDTHDTFTYTTTAPLPTDKIINLGPMILIIRQEEDRSFVAGRGIQQRCLATEYIFDPRLWKTQLLPNSLFKLEHDHDPQVPLSQWPLVEQRNDFVNVTLNAAALLELLVATKEQDRTWRPHDFGLQHGIIDMCKSCRLALQLGRRSRRSKPCQCVWTGSEESLLGQLRSLRRHYIDPI